MKYRRARHKEKRESDRPFHHLRMTEIERYREIEKGRGKERHWERER